MSQLCTVFFVYVHRTPWLGLRSNLTCIFPDNGGLRTDDGPSSVDT